MSRIAVTGASGTIGSRLCADLAADHDIVGIDLVGADHRVDVTQLEPLVAAFERCETVIHLAGVVDVNASWEAAYHAGMLGTYNAFEAARRVGAKRVIFASSNHAVGMYEVDALPGIYEPGAGIVVGVDAAIRPDSFYGVWKAFAEALGRYYSDAHGLQVCCVRIGAITAADDPKDESVARSSGWLPLNETQKYARYAATWMSQRDFARLVRAVLARDVPFAIVYGVGDNATRFWDLEPGRSIYGFWPLDGTRSS